MSADSGGRHPFLEDLTEDAVLVSTLVSEPVSGRERIKDVIAKVGSLYASQTPTFLGTVANRTLLQYDAQLGDGVTVHGVAVIERNVDGKVPRVSVTFQPRDAAMHLSERLNAVLRDDVSGAETSK